MSDNQINPLVAGALATAISTKIVEALVTKHVISADDGHAIYAGALNALSDPGERADAAKILRALMPGVTISGL